MVTTVILQEYDLQQADFDSVECETDLSEMEMKEVAYAFLDGKHPLETSVISSMIEVSGDRSRDQYLEDEQHEPEDPLREEYYKHYNFFPSHVPKSYVSDNWYEVFPDLDEILENALWTARKNNDLRTLQRFGITHAEGYLISEISREILGKLPEELQLYFKGKLSPRHLNDLLVDERLLYNKEHERGITEAGRQKGIYSILNPGNENTDAYVQIFFSEQAREKVIQVVCSQYPELKEFLEEPVQEWTPFISSLDEEESIVGNETNSTPEIAEPETVEESRFLRNYCCMMSVEEFLTTTKDAWLSTMKNNFHKVCPYLLTDAEIRAWEDEYNVLSANLSPDYKDLTMIFEYVMPANRHRGMEPDLTDVIRADLVILSADTVAIFEFKQMDNDDRYTLNAAKKYGKSIRRYHLNSRGMRKKSALVLTIRDQYYQKHHRLVSCSPDNLPAAMDKIFEGHSSLHPDPEGWAKTVFKLL